MASGRLGEEPIERALATLDVFAHFCRASGLGAEAVDAVATSAIRDAENAESSWRSPTSASARRSACSAARPRPAMAIWRRSTRRRSPRAACWISAAARCSWCGSGAAARESGSWRLGTVRMSERFLPPNGPAKRRQLDELREHIAAELAEAAWLAARRARAPAWWDRRHRAKPRGGRPARGRAALQRRAGDAYRARRAGRADRAPGGAAGGRAGERAGHQARAGRPDPGRRAGRPGGDEGGRLRAASRRPRRACARASSSSVCWPRPGRAPLFEDVRRASVMNMAAQYRVDVQHTEHVAALALGMFDELAALGLHDGDPRERELLWAACMLHDIGMSIDYDDHHKHSRYLILNGGLPGSARRDARSSPRRPATTARACPRRGRWRRCSARATSSG